jgi:phosphoribosyl 1,2-cyclic phosphodiesterase
MRVTLWGVRGSLAAPGADTARYGGNTSCVEVRADDATVVILDAGTGIRPLGRSLPPSIRRIDLLLTHLHMDHIQGLGFFAPLFEPNVAVHLWGPPSTTLTLRERLMRYLSPPLFPVHLRDIPSLTLHEVSEETFQLGELHISAAPVCHPGPTIGYRIAGPRASLAYIPDHEPALGAARFCESSAWTSGFALAEGVDLLVHDAQYTGAEYAGHVGWGHSAIEHAIAFAQLARAQRLVTFHHDPTHSDDDIDRLTASATSEAQPAFRVTAGAEGAVFQLG